MKDLLLISGVVHRKIQFFGCLFIGLCIFLGKTLHAQVVPDGTETLVNTTTAGSQQNPAVAMDSSGNFIVVWESFGTDGDGYGIYAQRFLSGGTPDGSEFLVNTTTTGDQRYPDVAMDPDGNFVIVWMDDETDGSGWGCYRRTYDNTGSPTTSVSRINSSTSGHQRDPKVAMDENGNFVMTWLYVSSDGGTFEIHARNTNSSGANLNSVYQVNTSAATHLGSPDVSSDANGNYTIVWQASGLDGGGQGIYGQRYDNSFSTVGSEFLVNNTTAGNQFNPVIDMTAIGRSTIAWCSEGQDGDAGGIYARQYLNDGTAAGTEFLVNTTTAGSQTHPFITSNINEFFIISWSSYGTDGNYEGAYMQVYDDGGRTIDSETRVNTRTTDFQQLGALAMYKSADDLVVAWQDGLLGSTSTHDGDDFGIYIQRYDLTNPFPVDFLTFTATPQSDNTTWLDWTTGVETNNLGFFIEHKWKNEPGQSWQDIGFVQGVGNSQTPTRYSFIDHSPLIGNNFYRLRQIDIDGNVSYSDVRNVYFESGRVVFLYPNPVKDVLNLDIIRTVSQSGHFDYTLIDGTGRSVMNGDLDMKEEHHQIQVSHLPSGIYTIRLNREGMTQEYRFVKRK